jgi:hypothetical protein
MSGGDSYRSSASCFAGVPPPAGPGHAPAGSSGALFTREPSNGLYMGFMGYDPVTGIAVMQAGTLDLVAFYVATGQHAWQTYNLSGLGVPAEGSTVVHAHSPGSGSAVRDDGAEARRWGRAATRAPAHAVLQDTMAPPPYVAAGVIDSGSGTLFTETLGVVTAAAVASGQPLWNATAAVPPAMGSGWAGYGALRVMPPGPSTPSGLVLSLGSVYSNIPGVVTAALLVAYSPASRSQVWTWYPSMLRSGCTAPSWLADGSALFTLCATNMTSVVTQNVNVYRLDPATGAVAWASPVAPPTVFAAYYDFTSNVLVDSAAGLLYVGWSSPANPCTLVFSAATGALLQTVPMSPATPLRGFVGPLQGRCPAGTPEPVCGVTTPFASVFGVTALGAVASIPTLGSQQTAWNVSLGLGAPGPYMNQAAMGYGGVSYDAGSGSLWTYAYNGNGTVGLFCVQAPPDWSAGTLVLNITYASSPWAIALPTVVPYPLPQPPVGAIATPTAGVRGAARATTPAAATGPTVRALYLSTLRELAALDVTLGACANGGGGCAPAAAAATPAFTVQSRGDVMCTPAMFTNPADPSQALYVYVGYDDDIIRAVDPATGGVVWSAALPDNSGLSCDSFVGSWAAGVLVAAEWYGDVYVLSLTTGTLLQVLRTADYWAALLDLQRYAPLYVGDMVLLDDPSSPSGLAFVTTWSTFPQSAGVLAKLALPPIPAPLPAQPPAVYAGSALTPFVVWNVTTPISSGNTFGYLVTYGVVPLPPSGATQPVLFVSSNYGPVRAFNSDTGVLVWSARPAPPDPPSTAWSARALVYAPATASLFLQYVATTANGYLGALARADARTGSTVWALQVCPGPQAGMAVEPVAETTVYATCSNAASVGAGGKLGAYSAVDGSLQWWGAPASDSMASGPTLSPAAGVVVLGVAGGALYALSAANGSMLASALLPGAAAPAPFGELNNLPGFVLPATVDAAGGVYVAGGTDGYLYQVALVPGLGPAPSPTPSANPGAVSSNAVTVGASVSCAVLALAAAGGVMWWRRRSALRPAGLPSVSGALGGTLGTMATTRGDGGGGRDLSRAMLTDAYEAVPT